MEHIMTTNSADSFHLAKPTTALETKSLVPFLALTFGLTWGLAALLFLFYDQIVAVFGEISMSNPLTLLAVYAVLYHFQMMNPLWPDAQPWDNLMFVGVAVIVVWLNRRSMFRRGEGVTEIVTSNA